ncbi:hypothetical protein QRN89_22565 [Streptomyces chengbuensis]|uniref:hypothetical protein n=1 Tax=Streptomyces chengbuensis TaxID=3053466 RepID=UPI0025B2BA2B|nr:hypothetical protein [Streptomyces sp. HUAS CB01]WJY52342.1 hypothetical protein QRN89_22565 [Streptomyces sp. HUAS CB01]
MAVLLLLLVVAGALGAVMDSFARLAAPDPPPRPRGRRRAPPWPRARRRSG